MKTGKLNVKTHGSFGPGGWKCTCCGPAPRYRSLEARLFKRRMNRILEREKLQDLIAHFGG